jgi:hypothetical protein
MKNIRELKKVLIRQIFSNPKRFMKECESNLEMLNAAMGFLESNYSDESYIQFIISKLCYEKGKLMEANIPVEKWPKQLRPENWSDEVWKSFGIEEPVREEPVPPPQVEIKFVPTPEEEFKPRWPKAKPKPVDNPFKSDSFGEI